LLFRYETRVSRHLVPVIVMETSHSCPPNLSPDRLMRATSRSGDRSDDRSGDRTPNRNRRSDRRVWRLLLAVLGAVAALVAVTPPATGQDGGGTLEELRSKRNQVQAQQAEQASQVDALQASASEAQSALAALNSQVNAQRDRVEEAERSVASAEDEQVRAEAAQAQAQRELDALHADLRDVAVDAYIAAGGSDTNRIVQTASAGSANEAVQMRTLLSVEAGGRSDLIEDYRTVQDDLELQRQLAAEAAERAREQRQVVSDRLAELADSQSQQQAYTAQVEARVEAALAEAQSLASVDAELANAITARETELARAVAAQRAAETSRDEARAAQGLESLAGTGSSSGSTSSAPVSPPPVTGSGEIVNAGGIPVHRSIAGNVAALLGAAAADGVPLSGSGYRDSARQIELRRQHCGSSAYAIYQASASSCSPPTARPGSSMHERGLAIDFRNCNSRGSACYRWLAANASRFGLFNLPSEPWHWSTTGQ
jgi:peptidoglycan hydrolase CwlO-like protein